VCLLRRVGARLTGLLLVAGLVLPLPAWSASAQEIEIKVAAALKLYRHKVSGAEGFLARAKGVLVFPSIFKAGIGIGGEYGEGALQIAGKTVDYYNTVSASIGFQLGAQTKSLVLVFLEQKALDDFRASNGWRAGIDGSVAVAEWGVGENVDTTNVKDPIVAFVFGNKGLMYNVSLEGSKFTRISR